MDKAAEAGATPIADRIKVEPGILTRPARALSLLISDGMNEKAILISVTPHTDCIHMMCATVRVSCLSLVPERRRQSKVDTCWGKRAWKAGAGAFGSG